MASSAGAVSKPRSWAIMLAVSKSISSLMVARMLFFISSVMMVATGKCKISLNFLTVTEEGRETFFRGSFGVSVVVSVGDIES